MRVLCAAVLGFEAVVIGLAIPVAVQLAGIAPGTAAALWGSLAAAAVVLAALQRFTWAVYAGSALQLALVASGFVLPGMLGASAVGVIFGGLWVAGIVVGGKVDAQRAAQSHTATAHSPDAEQGRAADG